MRIRKMGVFFGVALLVLCIVVGISMQVAKPRHHVAFAVSESSKMNSPQLKITLDRNEIGVSPLAFARLAEIEVNRGDMITIDITQMPVSKPGQSKVYYQADFLQKWMLAGAKIYYFRDNRK